VQLTPLAEEHLPLLDALISDPETLRFTREAFAAFDD
jgi:hypothetical protein